MQEEPAAPTGDGGARQRMEWHPEATPVAEEAPYPRPDGPWLADFGSVDRVRAWRDGSPIWRCGASGLIHAVADSGSGRNLVNQLAGAFGIDAEYLAADVVAETRQAQRINQVQRRTPGVGVEIDIAAEELDRILAEEALQLGMVVPRPIVPSIATPARNARAPAMRFANLRLSRRGTMRCHRQLTNEA